MSAISGTYQYGCNTLTKRCSCGTSSQQYDTCTSNGQCCSATGATTCLLMVALDSTVYRTIPCDQCQCCIVVCLLAGSGTAGQCTCLMDMAVQMDSCAQAAGGYSLSAPFNLCRYAAALAGGRDRAWTFAYDYLMLVLCSSAFSTVCSVVYTAASATIPSTLSVATLLRSVLSGTSRRLL